MITIRYTDIDNISKKHASSSRIDLHVSSATPGIIYLENEGYTNVNMLSRFFLDDIQVLSIDTDYTISVEALVNPGVYVPIIAPVVPTGNTMLRDVFGYEILLCKYSIRITLISTSGIPKDYPTLVLLHEVLTV